MERQSAHEREEGMDEENCEEEGSVLRAWMAGAAAASKEEEETSTSA